MIGRSDFTNLHWLIKPPADTRLYTNHSPVWSPDGRRIAYVRYSLGAPHSDIHIVTASGHQVAKLATLPGYSDFSPAWASGGREIVFELYKSGDNRFDTTVWIGRVSTGHVSELYGYGLESFGISGQLQWLAPASSR